MTKDSTIQLLYLACMTIVMSGCNLAPNFLKPDVPLPVHFKTSGPWRTATPKDEASRGSWWSLFGDARLNALMKQAQAGSPRLELALHRVTGHKLSRERTGRICFRFSR
jgi:outer membrane protein TolC